MGPAGVGVCVTLDEVAPVFVMLYSSRLKYIRLLLILNTVVGPKLQHKIFNILKKAVKRAAVKAFA